MVARKVYTADCETDPFLEDRVPEPFIWGLYGSDKDFNFFYSTQEFVEYVRRKHILIYAHNGGKFDWMYILPFLEETKAQIINGRYVSLYLGNAELRDSYAIIPEPLASFGFKKEIEHWKLEKGVRDQYMDEIKAYNYQDCKGLHDAVTAYRNIAGKRKTIASNALAFARKLGIEPGRTNHRFDTKYRRFFYGGRVEVYQPGTHQNIYLLDIHSAYPFAMIHNHATGNSLTWSSKFRGMTDEQIQRSFICLHCHSDGVFPKRSEKIDGGGLSFPHGYNEYHVTGWEYLAAKEFGLIKNETITYIASTDETINFKPYVDHWFKFKSEHSAKNDKGERIDPVNYTIGKIMQNSLYGKLAQDISKYYDHRIRPAGTPICDFEPSLDNPEICGLCKGKMKDHGWQLYLEYDNREVHRRSSLWKYKFELGVEWEAKRLYYNVATGASITGFTRAHLLRAMHTIGMSHIIYCDTDGIVCDESSDISGLSMSDALGDWGLDDKAPIGHFAGKKLYGIRLSITDPKTGKHKVKIASKGSKLAFTDLETIINGGTVKWANKAPTFSIDGSARFVRRNIRATAQISALTGEQSKGT